VRRGRGRENSGRGEVVMKFSKRKRKDRQYAANCTVVIRADDPLTQQARTDHLHRHRHHEHHPPEQEPWFLNITKNALMCLLKNC
jgi:hypothetical protein